RGDCKAEFRWADRGDLVPIVPGILGTEDAIVMLAPHDLRTRRTAREAMDVLRDRQPLLLRRHVLVVHALVDDAPRFAAIGARPNPGSRDADADVVGMARIDQHGADAGLLAAGDALPLPALRHSPQRLVQRPGLAAVVGS